MKTAVRVLVIIAAAIGFIWSIVVFGGGIFAGGIEAALTEDEAKREEVVGTYVPAITKTVFAFIFIIAGLVFGIVCAREKSSKATTMVNGLLLLLCGIAATALQSWIAGPIYVVDGFLGFLSGLMIKAKPKQEDAGN
ncbi:MAG: hypothetical protein FVQ80_17765 [Planctomycetes bacterium]|nr:hypothetical protein [Planctomycetota bacterium]